MKKIMIIDDEIDIIEVLQRFLQRSKKLHIEIDSNPETAIKKIQNSQFDLVLSDIMMPTLNGLEILEQIKNISPSVKVLLMTAYSTKTKIDKSKELNADGYIEKPFNDLKEIEELLFSILNI